MDRSDIVENFPPEHRSDERTTGSITLRQWRAAQAINALLMSPHAFDDVEAVVAKGYEIADAQRKYEDLENQVDRERTNSHSEEQPEYEAPPTIPDEVVIPDGDFPLLDQMQDGLTMPPIFGAPQAVSDKYDV